MNAPMLIPLVSLIAGILCARAGLDSVTGGTLMLVSALIYMILLRAGRNPVTGIKTGKYHWVWVALLFAGVGVLEGDFSRPFAMPADDFSHCKGASGRIKSISHRTTGDRCEVTVSRLYDTRGRSLRTPNFSAILSVDDFTGDVDDVVVFPALFERIADSPNSISRGYAARMADKGILYTASIEDADIHYLGHTPTLMGIAWHCRDRIEAFIENTQLRKATQNFLITVLLGDRAYLSNESRATFADAGVSHILALSGMHIMIIAGIFFFLLFPLNFRGWYKGRIVVATAMVFIYAFLTGASPSTIRSCIMASCVALCIVLERKNSAWNSLLLAAFIILLFSPWAIYDVGLQLSFVCVASLIFFANRLNPVEHHEHPRLYKAVAAILAALVATGASWVLSAYYFHIFPLLFLPANLLLLPLLPFYLVGAIIYLALHACGLDIALLGEGLDGALALLFRCMEYLGGNGESALTVVPSAATVALWLAGIGMLACCMTARRKMLSGSIAAALLIAAVAILPFGADANRRELLVSTARNRVEISLYDKGLERKVSFTPGVVSAHTLFGRRWVAADCDVSEFKPDTALRCDYLILSGGFKGELADILERIKPDTLVIHTGIFPKREEKLIEEAGELGIPVHSLRRQSALRRSF